jgi:hypothetical protein
MDVDDERLFTLDEANALLPRLRPLLQRLQEVQARLANRSLLDRLRTASAGNGGGSAAREAMSTGDEFGRITAEIATMGVVVRDAASGLVDFPAEREGRQVFLCWRVGEEAVGHWHDRDSGFMGRQPL